YGVDQIVPCGAGCRVEHHEAGVWANTEGIFAQAKEREEGSGHENSAVRQRKAYGEPPCQSNRSEQKYRIDLSSLVLFFVRQQLTVRPFSGPRTSRGRNSAFLDSARYEPPPYTGLPGPNQHFRSEPCAIDTSPAGAFDRGPWGMLSLGR